MHSDVGSSAALPCPRCRSSQVKVALITQSAIFYRCSECRHGWSAPRTTQSPDGAGARQPKDIQSGGSAAMSEDPS
jgi:hypothetical protein